MSKPRQRAEDFTRRLKEVYGADLLLVLLYGSAARGDYREGVSDLNLLVVLRELDAQSLRRGSALAREWVAEGNPPPMMLSEREWAGSADVFAIEYTDIRDAHVVLHGAEPFGAFAIHWRHLRLQCERELKSKKIQLRERYLFSAESAEEVGALLCRALPTFLTLFRAGLRLAGAPVPREPGAVVDAVAAQAGFDPRPLHEVIQARGAGGAFATPADGAVATGYLAAVAAAADWVDRLDAPDPGAAI